MKSLIQHAFRGDLFRTVPVIGLVISSGLMSSCSTGKATRTEVIQTAVPARAFWNGDGVSGSAKIVIDLSEQRLRYYKGGELVGVSPISSGTPSHPTPTGSFRITEKDIAHRSSCYGEYVDGNGNVVNGDVDCRVDKKPPGCHYVGASMRYFMRVKGGVGMHEGYLPGFPASHGCIRLPTQMAAIFYGSTPTGTPVQITGSASNATSERAIAIGEVVTEDKVIAEVKPATTVTKEERKTSKALKKNSKKAPEPKPLRGQTQYLEGA
jgi:hypothetical protein